MAKRKTLPKEATSIRLTPEAKKLFAALAEREGMSQAAWLEMVIRRESRRMKVRVDEAAADEE